MKDLTKGNIAKLIISFALPLLFGNIFQLFYNLADTRIVGQFIGKKALAAIGATSSLNTVIVGFLNGLACGFSIITAKYFGAKDYEKLRHSIGLSLTLGIATSLFFTVFSVIFTEPLLKILNTPDDIIKQAKSYIIIIFAGMTITLLYDICAAVLRAVGDTVSPLIFLIISTIINIILDLIFIIWFKTGVGGAAVATIISQLISVILCFIYIFKKHKQLIPHKKDFSFNINMAGNMYASGVSMGLMISLVGIGTLVMQGAINKFGTDIIFAHTTARKISEIYFLPISVFGMAAATFSGQNLGAGRLDRVRKGIIQTTLITWAWSVVCIALSWLCTPFLVHLITGTDSVQAAEIVTKYMKINTALYFVLDMVIIFRNALQGIGDKISPIASSFLELAGKCLVAKILAPRLGYFGIMISEPIVWVGMTIILSIGLAANKTLRKDKKSQTMV